MDPGSHQPMDRVTDVTDRLDYADAVQWYDITIAGRQFNSASRHGEGHIRRVERLLEKTVEDVTDHVQGKSPATVALLTALNLADQLLISESDHVETSQALNGRLQSLLGRLENALGKNEPPNGAPETSAAPVTTREPGTAVRDKEFARPDTPAVFD